MLAAIDHDLIRLAVKTLSLTGIRVGELCELLLEDVQVSDVDSKEQVIHVIDGKGGKDRKMPVPYSLVEDLVTYLEHDRLDVDTENFFALEKSGGLSPQYINRVLRETIDKLGWDKEINSQYLFSNDEELRDTVSLLG